MKNLTLVAILILTISISCSKEQQTNPLEDQLIGRWETTESTYVIDGEAITTTFGPDGNFPAEYSIGIDYSSGFDLQENSVLDLIWYSQNKRRFFTWELEEDILIIDEGRLSFKVLRLERDTAEFELLDGTRRHKMARLD